MINNQYTYSDISPRKNRKIWCIWVGIEFRGPAFFATCVLGKEHPYSQSWVILRKVANQTACFIKNRDPLMLTWLASGATFACRANRDTLMTCGNYCEEK